jgi:outer membrane protein TolC
MNRFPISRSFRAAVGLAGILALAAPSPAQQRAVVSAQPGQRVARPFPAPVDGALRLSLEEAVKLAIANNQDLNVAVNAAEASQYNLLASEGIFDPLIGAFANRNHQETPSNSALSGAAVRVEDDSYNFGANVQQLAPWGGTFTLGTTGGRFSTNSSFASVNPSFSAGLSMTMSQPLLRNFGMTATKWQISIARNSRDATYQQFVRSIQTGVNSVEQAYWDLVYAFQNLEVKKESLRIAKDLNRITKIKIDVGSLAPIDITQTEVGIATAEQDIITAEQQIGDSQDSLRRLINIDLAHLNVPIIPTDEVREVPATIDVEAGTRAAIIHRPEVVTQTYLADSDRVRYEYWSNQVLPSVNLLGSFGTLGQGGTFYFSPCAIPNDPRCTDPNNPPPPVIIADNGLGNAYDQTLNRNFRNWSIGLSISYPIFNRYAKGQRGAAHYSLEASRALLTTTQQNVVVEVRAAARAIDTALRQIVAAGKGRELAEKNLDAEKKKFDNGMTTSFQVNQIQLDLSSARTRELQALVIYRKALAAYHYAVADILDWRGIGVEGMPDMAPASVPPLVPAVAAK